MSRGWTIGIVCLAISGTSVLACWAQDARSQNGEALSLTERLAAVRDKFRRDKPEETPIKKSARTQSSQADGPVLRRLGGDSQDTKRNSAVPRVQPNDLLPDNLFGRTGSVSGDRDTPTANQSNALTDAEALDQFSTGPALKRPAHGATNAPEADSVLAGLTSAEEAHATDQPTTLAMGKRNEQYQSKQAKPVESDSVESDVDESNTFDLHQALVSDDESDGTNDIQEQFEAELPEPAPSFADNARQKRVAIEAPEIEVEPSAVNDQARSLPMAEEAAEELDSDRYAEQSQTEVHESRPMAATRQSLEPIAEQDSADPFAAVEEKSIVSERSRRAPMRQSPARVERQDTTFRAGQSGGDLLLSYQQPVIVSHVEGPRRITVGREATYQVTLENTSNTDSKDLSASIHVPEWAEVVDAVSTSGVVERGNHSIEANVLDWRLHELAAGTSANLRLRLIPRSGQALQLGVKWTQAPVASQTLVEVQEPKLQIEISGPQEVLFGNPKRYRLTLRNPGTGPAEELVVQLIPPGGDPQSATTQPVGTLEAGEVKDIELELTAREAGELVMHASAVAAGGLTAEAEKTVVCLKPELQLDWRGPETKYAGTIAAYHFRIRNPGTAMTEPVTVQVQLPEGAKFEAASSGYEHDPKTGMVAWRLAGVGIGEEKFMQVRCQVDKPGANHFEVTAQTDDGGLQDTKAIQTEVVALADLELDVSDPRGPVALGEPVLYEIRVRNRGKTAAEGVSVVGLFSAGIDPTSVEGAQYTVRDGRVTFHPITSLPAGREIVLRIRAKASQEGTHVFRAEVACRDLEIKLAAEETTRFFQDEYRWDDTQTPYTAENSDTDGRY